MNSQTLHSPQSFAPPEIQQQGYNSNWNQLDEITEYRNSPMEERYNQGYAQQQYQYQITNTVIPIQQPQIQFYSQQILFKEEKEEEEDFEVDKAEEG